MESPLNNGAPENNSERPELSEREREILKLVASGASNKQIAQQLVISLNTVKVHVRNIFGKIGVASRTEAALYAIRAGLVRMPGESVAVAPDEDALPLDEPDDGGAAAEIATAPASAPPAAEGIEPTSSPVVSAPPAQPRRRPVWLWWAVGVLLLVVLIAGGTAAYSRLQPTPTAAPTEIRATAIPRWKALAGLPTPRSGLAAVIYENQLFAIAGQTATGVTGAVERYDTATGVWAPLTAKPVPVANVGAAVIGGKIYVPGGRLASGEITQVLEVFDPNEGTWEQRADLPAPVSAYAMVAFEGRLYLFGGWDGQGYLATVYVYDPSADVWTEGTPMPSARAFAGAAVGAGRIYVVGGANEADFITSNDEYSPQADRPGDSPWRARAPLPAGRSQFGAAGLADQIYVIGGTTEDGGGVPYRYRPQDDAWLPLEEHSGGAWSGLAVGALDGYIYAVGGVMEGSLTAQAASYQAIYTVSLPEVNP